MSSVAHIKLAQYNSQMQAQRARFRKNVQNVDTDASKYEKQSF
ncbi:hypothetical protein [Dapis sp. BLCC M229]